MSTMKDLHADVMDLLEQSVDDDGLDTCACSGEALHAARAFVTANRDEEVRALGAPLRRLDRIEIRRFAVALDGSHRSHEPHHIASLRAELADAPPPFEIPVDLRAVLLEAFPLPGQPSGLPAGEQSPRHFSPVLPSGLFNN